MTPARGSSAAPHGKTARGGRGHIPTQRDRIAASHPDRWDGFRLCFHAYLDLATDPARRRLMFQEAPAVLGGKAYEILIDSGLAGVVRTIAGLAAAGRIEAPDPTAVAHVLNGAVVNLAFWVAEAPGDEDRRATAHATLAYQRAKRLTLRGLLKPADP